MNTINCPGCQRPFAKGIAIRAHERSYPAFLLVGRERLKQRGENKKKRQSAKLARLEEQTIEDERQDLRNELLDNITF